MVECLRGTRITSNSSGFKPKQPNTVSQIVIHNLHLKEKKPTKQTIYDPMDTIIIQYKH